MKRIARPSPPSVFDRLPGYPGGMPTGTCSNPGSAAVHRPHVTEIDSRQMWCVGGFVESKPSPGTMGDMTEPAKQRDVLVRGALNLHVLKQHLDHAHIAYEVVPLSENVPAVNFTAYYRDRTVRITATDEQWLDLQQWMDATMGDR